MDSNSMLAQKVKTTFLPLLKAIVYPASICYKEGCHSNDAWNNLDSIYQDKILSLAEEIRVSGKQKARLDLGFVQRSELEEGLTLIEYVTDQSEYLLYAHALKGVTIEALAIVRGETIINCNDRFMEFLGFSQREELLHEPITQFISELDLDRLKINSLSGSPSRTEIRIKNKNGKPKFVEIQGGESKIDSEDVFIIAFHDISARKKAEQELFQSKELYRSLTENSPNGVIILTNSCVEYINGSGLELLAEYDEDAIYGKAFLDFIDVQDQDKIKDLLDDTRQGKATPYVEVSLYRPNDELLKIGLRASLTVFEGQPSLQINLNNLSTREQLMQEKIRAQLAEEINTVLKTEIEEHKSTQRRLREARNYTKSIIESSIDMIMAADTDGYITQFNHAAQIQFGISEEEAKKHKARELFRDHQLMEHVAATLDKSGFFAGEAIAKSYDGNEFTAFLSASVIRNDKGEIMGSMGVARDITQLKKAEAQLIASEERYRDIFENATDFIFSLDHTGKFIYTNKAFRKAVDYSKTELRNMQIQDLLAPREDKVESLLDAIAGDNVELEFKTRDQEIIIAQGNASKKVDGTKPVSLRGIFRNVTEQRKSQREAIQQKAKLESIFNSTENMMMCTLSCEGQLTSYNNNFGLCMWEDFGLSLAEGDNYLKEIKKRAHPDLYQNQLGYFDKAFKGQAQQFELPVIDKLGKTQWLQHFLNPVYVDDSNVLEEISVLAYDVTERKEIDRKVRDSLREKEVLLQEVHHRVKNNLQVISSILNLQSGYVKDEKTLEILKESQNRIASMSFIHESLYQTNDFGSVEFGEYIESIARNLIHSYSYSTGQITLETDFDKIHLSLDQGIPCGLIVNELVSNVLKYAYPEKQNGRIFVGIKQKNGAVVMTIEDDGVGLPEGFNYEEADSLGVQLVYALSEQLDADLTVNSEKGTSFILRFTQT